MLFPYGPHTLQYILLEHGSKLTETNYVIKWTLIHSHQHYPAYSHYHDTIHTLPLIIAGGFPFHELSAAGLGLIVADARVQAVFHVRQHVRRRADTTWRVPNERIDLLCQPIALLEIDQRMPVNFDDGIAVGKGETEGGKERICRSRR